jgi:hypothetical protein
LKVQTRPFFEAFQLVASAGWICVVPGFKPTSPSNIWSITRSDSPSETSAPSSTTGSDAVPNTSVVSLWLLAPATVETPSSSAVTASGSHSLRYANLTFPPSDDGRSISHFRAGNSRSSARSRAAENRAAVDELQ